MMNLPFEISKTYTTTLSKEEVLKTIGSIIDKKNNDMHYLLPVSIGSIKGNWFKFQREGHRKGSYPTVQGAIVSTNPTVIHLSITPNYLGVSLFFILFLGFLLGGIKTGAFVKLWGAPFVWENYGLLLCVILPLIFLYVDIIRPLSQENRWIVRKLKLVEQQYKY